MTTLFAPIWNGTQFFDNNGNPLNGGKVFTYQANSTSILKTTYTDSTGATPNPNPLTLDSSGRIPNEMWLASDGNYNFVLTKADGTTVLIQCDNIAGASGGGGSSLPDQTGNEGRFLETDGTNAYWNAIPTITPLPQVFYATYIDVTTDGIATTANTIDEVYVPRTDYVGIDGTQIMFYNKGTYSVAIQGQMLQQANDNVWFNVSSSYGPFVILDVSMSVVGDVNYFEHYTYTDVRSKPFDVNGPSFNDTFIVQTAQDMVMDVALWAYSFYLEGEFAMGKATIIVTKISDNAGPWN
jgi:peptidoglycan hydrolase-like protein with peptidoglycan-binding domain